ncbi:hypothetical protein HYV12_01115 [Candidatus Dojkabacteria bacterium]|nr:hypothetical protein [Candidatus Dojkabacteria bacterium]
MDYTLVGAISNAGNASDKYREQLPPEPSTDLPVNVESIEQTQLFVITKIQLKGSEAPLTLDDPVRVFRNSFRIDGVITEFEIERDPLKGHKMFVHVESPVFPEGPIRCDTTLYQIVKKK